MAIIIIIFIQSSSELHPDIWTSSSILIGVYNEPKISSALVRS